MIRALYKTWLSPTAAPERSVQLRYQKSPISLKREAYVMWKEPCIRPDFLRRLHPRGWCSIRSPCTQKMAQRIRWKCEMRVEIWGVYECMRCVWVNGMCVTYLTHIPYTHAGFVRPACRKRHIIWDVCKMCMNMGCVEISEMRVNIWDVHEKNIGDTTKLWDVNGNMGRAVYCSVLQRVAAW